MLQMVEAKPKYKIAAVVVTYNRLALLQECITSLRNQTRKLDEIIVVNNSSTDGTFEWLSSQTDLTVITQENSGSAGGQHTGIKTAYERGHDWIWCMDDDGFPDNNCLATLVRVIKQEMPAVVSPIVLNKINHSQLAFYSPILKKTKYLGSTILKNEFLNQSGEKIIEGFGFFYNGVLISRGVITKVGLPIRELFIWGEEQEYFFRMKKNKIRMVTCAEALFYHPQTRLKLKKILFDKYAYAGTIDDRYYYLFRNKGYISKTYFRFFDIKYVISQCVFYVVFCRFDIKSLRFFLKAYFDGIKLNVPQQ
jgi:rhamnopyranosyl-N-acetylglucosaminyl-diphospho-decaprenol beta-1,3/1,4-galactofuranosyltransferase